MTCVGLARRLEIARRLIRMKACGCHDAETLNFKGIVMVHTVVIFGASGDLTSRKLIPALYRLHQKVRLPEGTSIVGVSRTKYSDKEYRSKLRETTEKFEADDFEESSWIEFAKRITYQTGDINSADDFAALGRHLAIIEQNQPSERVYYLSVKPGLYPPIVEQLGAAGLVDESHGARRLVVEKPFGRDRETAQSLSTQLNKIFKERQVFRIDHYLGKETVQNLLVLRFANSIFEPIWNRHFIDHVQITVAESVEVGSRAGYYDTSGVLRDMFQNHLLQLMTITAMEAPAKYDAQLVRDEKVKVLQAVRSMPVEDIARDTMRAQYDGYLSEKDVPSGSETATFAAIKLHIDNWRWQGVPFYLRSGKAMSCRTTQIVIQFRCPPLTLFPNKTRSSMDTNRLVIQVQPAEGMQLYFQTKVPDAHMKLRMTEFDFRFDREFRSELPDAYERLLLDAMNGDASLFARRDEVDLAWGIIDPILAAWSGPQAPAMGTYPLGQWGPSSCMEWMNEQGRDWFDVCPVLH